MHGCLIPISIFDETFDPACVFVEFDGWSFTEPTCNQLINILLGNVIRRPTYSIRSLEMLCNIVHTRVYMLRLLVNCCLFIFNSLFLKMKGSCHILFKIIFNRFVFTPTPTDPLDSNPCCCLWGHISNLFFYAACLNACSVCYIITYHQCNRESP